MWIQGRLSGLFLASPVAVRPLTALLRPPSALLRPLTALLRLLTVGVWTMLRSGVHLWATIRESNLRRQIATLIWARSDHANCLRRPNGWSCDNVSWQKAYSCFNLPSARPVTDATHAERRILVAHSSQCMQLNARLFYVSHSFVKCLQEEYFVLLTILTWRHQLAFVALNISKQYTGYILHLDASIDITNL